MDWQTRKPKLGSLLREVGFSHERLADVLGVSTQAVDSWASGRNRIGLDKVGPLVELLEQHGVAVEHVRELILEAVVAQGLSRRFAEGYLGLQRVPIGRDAHVAVVWELRSGRQQTVVTVLRGIFARANRDMVCLDCSADPAVRRDYLRNVVPALRPASVVVSQLGGHATVDLDVEASQLARLGIPTVYLQERPRILPTNAGYISWSDCWLGYIAGLLVADQGHKNIGILVYDDYKSHLVRKAGFEAAIAEYGPRRTVRVLVTPRFVGPYQDVAPLLRVIKAFLDEHHPDVVFVPSPELARAVVLAATERKDAHSERKLGIVVLGHEEWMTLWQRTGSQPTLTVVQTPVREAATKAAELAVTLSCERPVKEQERIVEVQLQPGVGVAWSSALKPRFTAVPWFRSACQSVLGCAFPADCPLLARSMSPRTQRL